MIMHVLLELKICAFEEETIVSPGLLLPICCEVVLHIATDHARQMAVYNRWTGLMDWTIGLHVLHFY